MASAGVVPRLPGGTGAAVAALRQTVIWLAVVLRGAVPVVGSGLLLLGATGPDAIGVRWLAAGVCLWALGFGGYALRRGLAAWLLAVDWVVAMATVTAVGRLDLAGSAGPILEWAAVIASMSVIAVQLAWPARVSVPVGLATAVLFGLVLPDRAVHVGVLVLQTVSAALVIALARRASRAAQGGLDSYHTARRTAAVSQARRADERAQTRRLHDTALSTLTMVASGAVSGQSAVLRARAAEDHRVITSLAEPEPAGPETPEPTARLDLRLAGVVARHPRLTVSVSMPALSLPRRRVDAIADAVGEALTNVTRHAGVSDVDLAAQILDTQLLVEVTDRGNGFDPHSVPAHRFGVRESIVGRMRGAGGSAEVSSAPAGGTTVRLRCRYG